MRIGIVKTELFCIKCNKETEHELIYISDKLARIVCLECGLTLNFDEEAFFY
jgi:transcription elongation factor Elf1